MSNLVLSILLVCLAMLLLTGLQILRVERTLRAIRVDVDKIKNTVDTIWRPQ